MDEQTTQAHQWEPMDRNGIVRCVRCHLGQGAGNGDQDVCRTEPVPNHDNECLYCGDSVLSIAACPRDAGARRCMWCCDHEHTAAEEAAFEARCRVV